MRRAKSGMQGAAHRVDDPIEVGRREVGVHGQRHDLFGTAPGDRGVCLHHPRVRFEPEILPLLISILRPALLS